MKRELKRFKVLASARAKIESACLEAMPLVFVEEEYEEICCHGFLEVAIRTAARIEAATLEASAKAKPNGAEKK